MSCNGFTNYATWLASLWLYDIFSEGIYESMDELIYDLENYIEENNPFKNDDGLYADMLRYIIKEINYKELAEFILE